MPPLGIISGALLAALLAGVLAFTVRRRRSRARELYQHHLEDALADGILTEDEAERLATLREDKALSAEEVRMVALTIYRRALRNAISDSRITLEEDETLQRLQQLLGLNPTDLKSDRDQLQRIHLLARVERGDLPRVSTPVPMDTGEVCHWVVQARLAQKLTIPGPARPPLARVSFRVDTSTPFHITAERDSLHASEEILPLDLGMLLITSRRTLFRGARRTAVLPHLKLERLELYSDGMKLEVGDNGPGLLLLVDDAELTAAILLTAARARRAELRGAPGRTA